MRSTLPKTHFHRMKIASGLALALATSSACTGQLPGAFRLSQREEAFDSHLDINTKIDLLWVVDNSASMDNNQDKLRRGFSGFATKYMQPTWDIRSAVITTDTYLAHPAFQTYLNSLKVGGTTGYRSNYIFGRNTTWVNPASNPNLVDTVSTWKFLNGVTWKDFFAYPGTTYSRLLPGIHDGPIPALCFEYNAYFFYGVTNCRIRDDQTLYNGPEKCLRPGSGEDALTQCVNTVENNTVRSGRAIIKTLPETGVTVDETYRQKLIDDFIVNITTGSAGNGSERGLESVAQLMIDNESTDTALFRKGSLRGIIFVSDEDDQSMVIPSPVPTSPTFTSSTYMTSAVSDCARNVDGYTYNLSTCPQKIKLNPVSDYKGRYDTFFNRLDQAEDGTPATDPNYFVVAITPLTGTTVQQLQQERVANDDQVGNHGNVAVDRGDRYLELVNQVGNGSLQMEIASSDYSPILDAIGRAIVAKKGTFTLDRAPTGSEQMVVKITHADGSETIVPSDQFSVSGKSLTFSSIDLVLGFKSTDRIVISYRPATVF